MKSALAFGLLLPLLLFAVSPAQQSLAQDAKAAAADPLFKTEELDQLLAPVALYPDELLAQVLTAATYPLEVVVAARWVAEPKHVKLKGEDLVKALQAQTWDASVKSLVPFPSVLKMMSERLDWTRKLGDAFLAQQKDCLAAVQRLRQRAATAGKLKSTKQMKVTTEGQTVVIEPANPKIVYVPAYNPTVVYGTWPYPAYPPYAYPPPPGYAFAGGLALGFAAGIAVNNNYWGWGRPNWNVGVVNINANRWNQINVNRTTIAGNTWQHNPVHRDGVAYRDAATRQRFGRQHAGAEARREFRGRQPQAARPGTQPVRTKSPAARPANRAAGAGTAAPRPATRAARQPIPTAFNPGGGAAARAASARGQFSRRQVGNFSGGAQSRGGGGRGRGGGFRR